MNHTIMKPFPVLLALLLAPACAPTTSTPVSDPDEVERKMIRLQENFPTHDTDGDDFLSRQELKTAMIKSGGRNVTDSRVTKVMKFYDFNGDGKISLREAQSGVVSGAEELIKEVR